MDIDGGTDAVIGTAPVRAGVRPGAVVKVRNANRGGDVHSATHLLTSARPGAGPSLFTPAAGGAVPNGAVWGACLGGRADVSTRTCPVPPVEGPTTWDGDDYLSLGAVLPGETREIRLADSVPTGRTLRLWCSLHPTLSVELKVGGSEAAPSRPAVEPAPTAGRAVGTNVIVAPAQDAPPAEQLRFAPATVTVAVGEQVRWRVPGRSVHTVEIGRGEVELGDTTPADGAPHAPRGPWDGREPVWSGFLSTDPSAPGGSTFSLRFGRAGRYTFQCRFHPQMTGTVVVR